MKSGHFMFFIFVTYLVLNALFALLYCQVGIEHLAGIAPGTFWQNFVEAFFFSTQTLTTVGYGRVAPQGIPANLLASIESLVGLMSFALISGLLYGRFSRPQAKIVFSENMVVAPFKNGRALMFRMMNISKAELIETEAQIICALNQADENGNIVRRFPQLELEINKISFFTLTWTLVHHLNESSPIFGFSQEDLIAANTEFLILIKGVEEASEQTVHSRNSYKAEEVVWNAKFAAAIGKTPEGKAVVSANDISRIEVLPAE